MSTLARYVLVDAADEATARELGRPALHELYADIRARLGRDVPIEIHTVRPATTDEIDMTTFATVGRFLVGGGTLAEVRDTVGHANVSITSTYLHVAVEEEAVGDLILSGDL